MVALLTVRGRTPYWLSGGPDAATRVLFTADAQTLVQRLERNLHGSDKSRALIVDGGHLVFRPTDRRDHLATALIPIGERRADHAFGVRLTTRTPGSAAGTCQVALQTQAYVTLATVPCRDVAGGPTDPHVVEFALPADTRSVRFYFVSADGRPTDLPSTMLIEVFETPASGR